METITVNGRERDFVLHRPEGDGDRRSLPLVLLFHGGGGNPWSCMRVTGFNRKADEAGFIAVYPAGTGPRRRQGLTWNAGRCCGPAQHEGVDDVGFIRTLVRHLKETLPVDPERIYAAGISNGGMMCYRLACEMSGIFAAVGPVAGALNLERCRPARPVSVIAFHGTADLYVRYDGGRPRKRVLPGHDREDVSVADSIGFWINHNGCRPEPAKETSGAVTRETYAGGRENSEVVLYTIRGGGHAWPGGAKGYQEGDEPTGEISATDLMWDFFSRHRRVYEDEPR